MKRLYRAVVILVLPTVMTGCASTTAYFVDRGRDAADILTVTVVGGLGGKVRVGPAELGLCGLTDMVGLRGGEISVFSNEPDREAKLIESVDIEWVIGPLFQESFEYETSKYRSDRHKAFRAYGILLGCPVHGNEFVGRTVSRDPFTHLQYATEIEVAAAVGVGFRFGLNPGELLDFFVGWFGIDIFDDDIEARRLKVKSSHPSDAPR